MYLLAQQMLITWLNSHGVNAYRSIAPDDAEFPYIVYDFNYGDFAESTIFGFSIYDNADTYKNLSSVAQSIEKDLPKILHNENGNILINKGSPFVQDRTFEDQAIKGLYINLELMYAMKEQ